MMARSTCSLFTLLAAGVLLSGCAGEATGPAGARTALSNSRLSPFVPSAAAKSLVGVTDGTYQFTVDPTINQTVNLGPNYLSLPANAICDIATSSYGATHWNETCTPQVAPVQITAVVSNSATDHPSIDFYPAMRFSPDKAVNLYIYVPVGMDTFQKTWTMKYCNDAAVCVNEALTDPDLATFADYTNMMVFRRVKHFSGYLVTGITDAVDVLPI